MKNKKSNPLESFLMISARSAALITVALMSIAQVHAFELGHSRVTSAPGQPLIVQVPITNITDTEAASLAVSLAPPAVWQAAGLNPPVALDTLTLSVNPGRQSNARLVEVRSSQPTERTVVDVLLLITTSASSTTAQASVIIAPPLKVRPAGDSVTVQRGDTLIGIVNQFPVSGANLYQQLWALYSANPGAFLRENMNLLKAGAALRIPDADAVRAVDPAFAKAQYLEHVRAFKQGRGVGQGNQGIAADGTAQTLQTPPEQQQGSVEQAGTEPAAPGSDQVRLTAAGQDPQADQADSAAAQAKAMAEELERKQALEKNIEALQGAIATAAGTDGQSGQEATGGAQQQPAESSAVTSNPGGQQGGSSSADSGAGGAQSSDSANAASSNFFSKVSQWVTDNTTAAIALLLALIALLLAWALRATKAKSSHVEQVQSRAEHIATDFNQKLQEIDLSLDDKPNTADQKPDNKG
jgi:pilus assembly protein FimV